MEPTMAKDEQRKGGHKRGPERTCAGCQKQAPVSMLVRVVVDPSSGEIALDLAGSGFGRGAHVHPSKDCVAKALKSGFARSFKMDVKGSLAAFATQIVANANRRIEGLLGGARRAGRVAFGTDKVKEELRAGNAKLVVVARDAAAAAQVTEVRDAIGKGLAIAWADKKSLGMIFSKEDVAVCAVLDEKVAAAIAATQRMAAPFVEQEASEAAWSSEVR